MDQTISAAEWQVMRVVWAHPGSTSQFIVQALVGHLDWQPATIKTLLGRLRKKGYLEMTKEEIGYIYVPLVEEQAHLKEQVEVLLTNRCSTKHGQLVQAILKAGQFSKEDLAKLEEEIIQMGKIAPERVVCHCLPGQCSCGCHH